ncbi:hypothetical protein MLC59_19460 [Marinobacter bryozoorum]|uniref:hypothetical protein n=1 Tax=Marinobacter bryozoorum TaxID=256324 RepID=UPI0020040A94|nr:hypothetical protein [Marinobacter bryozoorum]MCK7546334.1 hypothetical protein [Marinobacter bryozoorum]
MRAKESLEGRGLAGTNLVNTWKRITKHEGLSLGEAIEVLLSVTGYSRSSIYHGRIGQWERGEKALSPPVLNCMLDTVLPALLEEYKGGVITEQELRKAITVPVKTE